MFSILPTIVAFYFLFVGIFVLRQNKGNFLARIFFILCLSTFAWQFSWSLLFQVKNYDTAYFLIKFGWIFILFLPTTLYHFLIVLSENNNEIKRVYCSYIFSFFLLLTLAFSNSFISGTHSYYFGYYPKAGILHPLHVIQTTIVVLRGLYITYQKQKIVNNYRAKSQLRYCIVSLLIYLFAALDYLCNYGLEFYPPGIIFITISLTIISYTIVKHNLLDLNLVVSLILTRGIVYSSFLITFISCNFLITKNYLPHNLLYFFGSAILLIFICETYNYLIKKVQGFSDSIIAKQKKQNKEKIDSFNNHLESSASIEQLFENIKNFTNNNLGVELTSFYIKKELHKKTNSQEGDYVDIAQESNQLITLNQDFINHVVSQRLLIESNEYPKELLSQKQSQIFIPFINAKELIGFALLSSKKLFKFWHYEIFNSLTNHIGIVIDRIRVYREISLQKQKFLEDKAASMKSLAGSIAHELRNPLNAINLTQAQIKELLLDSNQNDGQALKEKLIDLSSLVIASIDQANNIINIILSDLKNKPVDPSDFTCLNVDQLLPEIIKKFGYKEKSGKQKIKLDLHSENNFIFKVIPERFAFIIYNLLKNALYYLKEYPESIVTVGTETKIFQGIEYNTIFIHDTGPGIPTHIIPKLFDDFYTSGKKEGTGLGLAFCKRNMLIFGGDIICESEFGQDKAGWTKFSLLFPKLSNEEIEKAKTEAKKKRILLVDDQEISLIAIKSKLEKMLIYVSCDIARSGKEAINMAAQNKYQLILMDVEMPEINGIEATRNIRLYDKEVPIIAFTLLNKDLFYKTISDAGSKNEFNYYLNQSSKDNLLYRSVSKWITDLQDDLSYVGTKEDCLKKLHGKKVILADDQQINRMMTKKSFESAGLIVVEASDGKELLEVYQKSLDANGKSDFDAVITDVNMPPHDGDDAAKEIRAIEIAHKISYHDEIPIIALSGDGDKKDIYHFFECQMTDYFIKGNKPELLLRIVANYL